MNLKLFAESKINQASSIYKCPKSQIKDHSLSALDPLKLLLYDFTAHISISVILPSSFNKINCVHTTIRSRKIKRYLSGFRRGEEEDVSKQKKDSGCRNNNKNLSFYDFIATLQNSKKKNHSAFLLVLLHV